MKYTLKNEDGNIFFIDSEKLEKAFSVYECYTIDEDFQDNIQDYRINRNDEFEEFIEENPGYTLSDVKEFILDFQEKYEVCPSVCCSDYHGRPTKVIQSRDSEDTYDGEGFYHDEELTDEVSDGDPYYLFESYWDGSNWRKKIWLSDFEETFMDDVSDEIDPEIELKEIASTQTNSGTGHAELYVGIQNGEKMYFEKTISYFQGQDNELNVIEDLTKWSYETDDEDIINQTNGFLSSIDELRDSEKLYVDSNSICFKAHNEEYHFDYTELLYQGYSESQYDFQSALNKARKAIVKRITENVDLSDIDLTKVYVTYNDSIDSGNCEEISTRVRNVIAHKVNAKGIFAFRADALLEIRDDSFSHRAISYAYAQKLAG